MEGTAMTDPTTTDWFEVFRSRYANDDNEWWRTECGEHQNLFEEACERLDALAAEVRALRDQLAEANAAFDECTGDYAKDLVASESWRISPEVDR
jgi:hypothetical protein